MMMVKSFEAFSMIETRLLIIFSTRLVLNNSFYIEINFDYGKIIV